jgi:hypothetical protein
MWPHSSWVAGLLGEGHAVRAGEVSDTVLIVDMFPVAKESQQEDRVSIQIPGDLQWVADFVGEPWPKGDEDAMYRIGSAWDNGSEQWSALIPDLNRIASLIGPSRNGGSSTMTVLQGQTAAAFDQRFKLLFDGDASAAKLVTAMGALGGLAKGTGKSIEKGKLQVLSSYAIAAFEIWYAEAQTAATLGESDAVELPIIRESTIAAIRRIVKARMDDILADLAKTMSETDVEKIVKKSLVKTGEGVGQNLFMQAVQIAQGHQGGINLGETEKVVLANATGGAAQGAVGVLGKRVLKNVPMNPILQGGLVSYVGAVTKQVVGSVAAHKPMDAVSLLGSPIKSGITGAIRGKKR